MSPLPRPSSAALALALFVVAAGCQPQTRPDALDVGGTAEPAYQAPANDPFAAPPAEGAPPPTAPPPVVTATPPEQTADEPATAAPSGERRYLVRRGDTLYSIAKQHYGKGTEYPRLLAANPGLSAQRLPIGREIVVP